MFTVRRPSHQAIERFIDESRELPLSYAPVGIVERRPRRRHDADEAVSAIGRGRADFERARAALRAWKQFDVGWVEIFPPTAPVEAAAVVGVLIRHLGFWSLNGCRVVYVFDDAGEESRFGFAYGTLTNHAEAGEEIFEVFMNPHSDEVMYRIRAVSWPRVMVTRLGYPVVRMLQSRFRRDSVEAMKRSVSSP